MSWPIPIIQNAPVAEKLKIWRWAIFFIVLIVLSASLFLFFFPTEKASNNFVFFSILLGIPCFIFAISLGIRLYSYGMAVEKYQVWAEEKKRIEYDWQHWAIQSLAIVDVSVFLPNNLIANDLIVNSDELGIQINQVLQISHDDLDLFEDFFFDLAPVLASISHNIPLNLILLSIDDDSDSIEDDIKNAYRQVVQSGPNIVSCQSYKTSDQLSILDNLLNEPKEELFLVIVKGKSDRNQNCSEFMAGILLGHPDFLVEHHIEAKSQLYRPILSDDLSLAIKQLFDMQEPFHHIEHIWYSNFARDTQAIIAQQLFELKIKLSENDSYRDIYQVDEYLGLPSKLSGWLALALAHQACVSIEKGQFIVTTHDNKSFMMTLTPAELVG